MPPHPFTAPPPPPAECGDAAADSSQSQARSPAPAADQRAPTDEGSKEIGRSGVILDSFAAASATGAADSLSDLRAPPEGEAAFRTRAGADLPVAAVGTLATPRLAVPDVRHVPGLGRGRTLVSVRQLARRGLAVTFGAESCSVKDPSTGAVVGEGRLQEEDGLYHLEYLRVPQS